MTISDDFLSNKQLLICSMKFKKLLLEFYTRMRKRKEKKPKKEGKSHGRWLVTKCKGLLSKLNYHSRTLLTFKRKSRSPKEREHKKQEFHG